MSQKKTVIATLLIRLPWDQKMIESWKPSPESQSHPGDLGNLMLLKCSSNEDTLKNLEALTELPGVQDVVVVYGESSWPEYAASNGITLEKHICPWKGCEGFNGSAIMGEVLYYTGPL